MNLQNVDTCINTIRHRFNLDDDELSTVNNLHTLIEVKANYKYIDGKHKSCLCYEYNL